MLLLFLPIRALEEEPAKISELSGHLTQLLSVWASPSDSSTPIMIYFCKISSLTQPLESQSWKKPQLSLIEAFWSSIEEVKIFFWSDVCTYQ